MLAFEKYRTTTANTSNSSNQLVFIFDEVIKLLYSAQKAACKKDFEVKFKAISKITEVFYILKSGIDIQNLDENNRNLDMFYGATIAQLEKINISDDCDEDIQQMIEALGDVKAALISAVKGSEQQSSQLETGNKVESSSHGSVAMEL